MELDTRKRATAGVATSGRSSLLSVATPALAALAVAAVFLLAYEVVERTWLRDVAMERLHIYHRVRGLLTSLIAAIVAGWVILRSSPPLFTNERESAAEDSPNGRLTSADRDLHYAHWFVLMRWIAVIAAVVLVFVAVRVLGYLPETVWWPLLLTIGGLALLNVVYLFVVRSRFGSERLLLGQVYGDLAVLAVLLHFSGGVENPLSNLMLIHVIIAGIVLRQGSCYIVAAVASGLYALMAWGEWSGAVSHYTLLIFPHHEYGGEVVHAAHDGGFVLSRIALHTGILLLTAYFAKTITGQLRRGERQLELFANRVLSQSQLLERSLETTGTALCVCDRQLRPTWANSRWQGLFSHHHIVGCETALAGGDAPARQTLKDGKARVTEVVLPGPNASDGHRGDGARTFLLTTAPLVDKDGDVTHVVELAREITEQKRMQERVIRTEKLAAVGELAGKVAHEVNNPIAIISAKTRLLLSDRRDELSNHTVAELVKITDLADRVARIAQGLLSYCRPSAGATLPIDVHIPIQKALAVIEPTVAATGVRLERRFSPGLPPVLVNAGEMEQVFLNLFVNALDAMPLGGRLRIIAEPRNGTRDERTIAVTVEDTGCGIPEEIRERVFEPFLTTKPEGKGTGLGLSICLGLVRSNGGQIELESRTGRGTRVMVLLPVASGRPSDTVRGEVAHA